MIDTNEIMASADACCRAGQIERAVNIYKQVIQKSPANPWAYHALGKIAFGKKNPLSAVTLVNRAITHDPNVPQFHNTLGVVLEDVGNIGNALKCYKRAISLKADYFEAYHNIAVALISIEHYELAGQNCQLALDISPDFALAYNTLGYCLQQQNKLEQAISSYKNAITLQPELAEPYNHIGVILNDKGETDSAVEYFKNALQADPAYAEAANNLGIAYAGQEKPEQAMGCFINAINSNPQMHNAYFNLADIHSRLNLPSDAADLYRKAIQINPNYPKAHNNLGITLCQLDMKAQAIEEYKKAIKLKPDFSEAYTNISIAETETGELNDALQHAKKATELSPEIAEYHYNLANTLKTMGNCHDALQSYDKAISLKTDYPEAIWNRSITLLMTGDLEKGFEQYKNRRDTRLNIFTYPNSFDKPLYDGGSLKGKRLLVHWEQGLGDSIQFVRFLPLLKKLGGHIIFEERKALIDIFKNIEGVDELITSQPRQTPEADFDLYAPLMDLPAILNMTIDSLPADVPYIQPDRQKADYWKQRLESSDLKVGIVWAGAPKHGNDHNRSCSLADFANLSNIDGVKIFSLQKGDASSQIELYKDQIKIKNLGDEFQNFSDTAAAIDNLDIIVSVDTSVLHLAGAMGKKTFAIIPYHPDWRWMLSTDKSPWYPTMKIFRQNHWGKWDDVFETVCNEIHKIKNNSSINVSSI